MVFPRIVHPFLLILSVFIYPHHTTSSSTSLFSAPSLAWNCSTSTATLSVSETGNYSLSLTNNVWLTNGDIALHYGRTIPNPEGYWLTLQDGTLPIDTTLATTGYDTFLGAYSRFNISFATFALTGFPFAVSFTCYHDSGIVSFDQIYPQGTPSNADISTFTHPGYNPIIFDNFNISFNPVAYFPSFDASPSLSSLGSSLGYIEWAGEFSWHNNNWGIGLSASSNHYIGGQLGGPVVLHTPSWNRTESSVSKPQAIVIGPLNEFKSTILALLPNTTTFSTPRWVFGPHGQLQSLPVNFSTRCGFIIPSGLVSSDYHMYAPDTGITSAVYQYGKILRILGQTTRFAPEQDIGVSLLSYWTDNGQIYDGDYWNQIPQKGTGGELFTSLHSWYQEQNIPVQSYQLDPYWFCDTYPGNGNWTPSVDVFGPGGFQAMLDAGMRLTLYSFFWAIGTANVFTDYTFVESPKMNNFIGGPIARIAANESYAFYSMLMQRCIQWNCVGFEHDFLDFVYLGLGDSAVQTGIYEQFMQGMSQAGVDAKVPLQLCMPLPSDVLFSTQLPGVSNIRASDDNDYTYAPDTRWKIGLTSLLHGAMNIRPFFDGTWSHNMYGTNSSHTDVPYPIEYAQNSTELDMLISVLSTGPVGLGDKYTYTNGTLALLTCASNGVLLKPSLPAAPIDLYFWYNTTMDRSSPLQTMDSEIWQAPSFIPLLYNDTFSAFNELWYAKDGSLSNGLERYLSPSPSVSSSPLYDTFPNVTHCPYISLLAVDTVQYTVYPNDLTPSIDLSVNSISACTQDKFITNYVSLPWSWGLNGTAQICADGVSASPCVEYFTATNGLTIDTGTLPSPQHHTRGSYHPFELYTFVPVFSNGYAVLGELNKFVRVSPVRFDLIRGSTNPSTNEPSLSFIVNGASNETVDVAILVPMVAAPVGNATRKSSGTDVAGTIKHVSLTFSSTGNSYLVVCTGSGSNCVCSVNTV